jgi:cytochrome c-type biogenesis protein CcmF
MAPLGQGALFLALVLASCGSVAAFVGAGARRPALVEAARRTAFAVLIVVLVVDLAMLAALLGNDFSIRYVAENSSRDTPTFFKVLSLWAADDGSLLLWNLILAGFVAAVAWRFRRDRPATFPYALGVLLAVQTFYLLLVNGPARPFATWASAPPDGRGPSPLLQNHPLMAVHPPFLYLGFIGFTVPFAFGIAALLAGPGNEQWVGLIRRWTLAVWCFLTIGLGLGALWSYSVLGWGGYWAWDPVENIALLPWLVSTAFLHSVMLQQRRGMAALWNITLVIGAFALMTFGTFLTRGSVLTSIHAFAESGVGPAYLSFLLLVLAGGFGLVAWRLPTLRSPARLDALLSREAAIIGNNVLLLAATGIVLLGTLFPLVVEAVSGQQLSVGKPYFERALAPVLLLLLLLVGTAPALPWRGGTGARSVARLRAPVLVAAAVMVSGAVAGLRHAEAAAGFGLAALVLVTNGREITTGARFTARRHGPRSLLRGSRRYGGLLVHVGLALLAAGIIASTAFAEQREITLRQGQVTTFAGYHVRYDGLRTAEEPQRTVLTARLRVGRGGSPVITLDPRLNLYPAASEPIGSPSIDRGVVWDLYASVIGLQQNGRSATFRLYRNPGVNWVWLGALVMVLGGLLAGWPGRSRRRPTGSTGSSATTSSTAAADPRDARPEPTPAGAG